MERARTERRMARRAEHVRRKRQVQAGIGGALALILLALGTTWLLGGFDSKPAETQLATCTWTQKDATAGSGVTATGLPPTSGEPRTGVQLIRIQTPEGEIQAAVDLARVPCAAASTKFLGDQGYYDGTVCTVLDTNHQTLTCGDREGTGLGSPEYQFPVEGKPTEPVGTAAPAPSAASPSPGSSPSVVPSYYAKGTIVLNTLDQNANGGQFSIVYGDGSDLPAEYTPLGTITSGMEIVEAIAAAGAVDATNAPAAVGKPAKDLKIDKLFVQDGLAIDPTVPVTPSLEATPSVSATS
jgi:peptidyl-prolyl cis-trans isomerase B (cyclophilin B)